MTGDAEETPPLIVSNEFAAVAVRKIQTRAGERLEVRSLRPGGRSIRLDALVLESLTWRTVLEVGEEGLRTPFGPTASEEPAPLLRARPEAVADEEKG
ncbi:MAG: dihydrodiol dehydrogenase [Actinomycetota bacterium]|nr:dihydrodiol dehydrogenase [Actinomycetota bacterium]